jgi:putative flippase GtrA
MGTDPRASAGKRRATLLELWRFYKVGVLNTAFGYGLYYLLLTVGLNLYVAQVVAHVAGMTFNFFMFKRHVFEGTRASVRNYIATYAVNYLVSAALLATFHRILASPKIDGLLAIVGASLINYVMLRTFAFKRPAE